MFPEPKKTDVLCAGLNEDTSPPPQAHWHKYFVPHLVELIARD